MMAMPGSAAVLCNRVSTAGHLITHPEATDAAAEWGACLLAGMFSSGDEQLRIHTLPAEVDDEWEAVLAGMWSGDGQPDRFCSEHDKQRHQRHHMIRPDELLPDRLPLQQLQQLQHRADGQLPLRMHTSAGFSAAAAWGSAHDTSPAFPSLLPTTVCGQQAVGGLPAGVRQLSVTSNFPSLGGLATPLACCLVEEPLVRAVVSSSPMPQQQQGSNNVQSCGSAHMDVAVTKQQLQQLPASSTSWPQGSYAQGHHHQGRQAPSRRVPSRCSSVGTASFARAGNLHEMRHELERLTEALQVWIWGALILGVDLRCGFRGHYC